MSEAPVTLNDRLHLARRYFEFIPHLQAHHMTIAAAFQAEDGSGFAEMKLPWRAELIGDPIRGLIHTGALSTLVDSASGFAVMCALNKLHPIATLDLRLDYLAAGRGKDDVVAKSRCHRLTDQVAFVNSDVYQGEMKIAQGVGVFMVGQSNRKFLGMSEKADDPASSK